MRINSNPPLPSTFPPPRRRREHAQTRTALLGFLHGKGFFGEVSKLLGGVRPGSGVALPALVVESIIGLLTQVRTGDGEVVVVMVGKGVFFLRGGGCGGHGDDGGGGVLEIAVPTWQCIALHCIGGRNEWARSKERGMHTFLLLKQMKDAGAQAVGEWGLSLTPSLTHLLIHTLTALLIRSGWFWYRC